MPSPMKPPSPSPSPSPPLPAKPAKVVFNNIDHYIAAQTPDVQTRLQRIRQLVHAAVPQATETISYRMPAFKLRRTFFYFAAFKNHLGVYPPVTVDAPLQAELAPYANAKGNLRFPLNQPLPEALISRVAAALSKAYAD